MGKGPSLAAIAAAPTNGIVLDDELATGRVLEGNRDPVGALVERGDQASGATGARETTTGANDRAGHVGSVPGRAVVVLGRVVLVLVLDGPVGDDAKGVGVAGCDRDTETAPHVGSPGVRFDVLPMPRSTLFGRPEHAPHGHGNRSEFRSRRLRDRTAPRDDDRRAVGEGPSASAALAPFYSDVVPALRPRLNLDQLVAHLFYENIRLPRMARCVRFLSCFATNLLRGSFRLKMQTR